MYEILKIAFTFFLMMDPIGNIPLYISSLKNLPPKRQRIVILREMLIALGVIVMFNFLGEALFNFLKITKDTIKITGGIILFLIALKLIFPPDVKPQDIVTEEEPFIVPLAIPLVAGPSILAAVMVNAGQTESNLESILAIIIAWSLSLSILIFSPLIARFLKQKGIMALERLMGLILVMLAIQMLSEGVSGFIVHECLVKITPN